MGRMSLNGEMNVGYKEGGHIVTGSCTLLPQRDIWGQIEYALPSGNLIVMENIGPVSLRSPQTRVRTGASLPLST